MLNWINDLDIDSWVVQFHVNKCEWLSSRLSLPEQGKRHYSINLAQVDGLLIKRVGCTGAQLFHNEDGLGRNLHVLQARGEHRWRRFGHSRWVLRRGGQQRHSGPSQRPRRQGGVAGNEVMKLPVSSVSRAHSYVRMQHNVGIRVQCSLQYEVQCSIPHQCSTIAWGWPVLLS